MVPVTGNPVVVLKMKLNVKDNDKCVVAFRFTAFYPDTGTMVPVCAVPDTLPVIVSVAT